MSGRAHLALAGALGLALVVLATLRVRAPAPTGDRAPEPPSPPPAAAETSPAAAATISRASPSRAAASSAGPAARPADPEASLLARLRPLVDADPAAAVSLCEDAERRFPSGALGDERSFLKMRALVHLGQIAAARDEAQGFFERFPDSPFGEDAFRLTGVHPRPAPPFGRGARR